MRITIIAPLMALLSGCDANLGKNAEAPPTPCFSIQNASEQPHSPILINSCTGQTWLLVKSDYSDKPEDGFTYQWFSINKLDYQTPTLVRGK